MARLLRTLAAVGLAIAVGTGTPGRAQAPQQPSSAQQPAADQPAPPPPPPTDGQQPVFRTGINFVRVDVIVTDKNGNTVEDLKPGDFEIVEQNKPQKIETFKLISLDGGLIPGPDGPPRQIRTDADLP